MIQNRHVVDRRLLGQLDRHPRGVDTAELLDRLAYFADVVGRCGGPAEREAFARIDEATGWRALASERGPDDDRDDDRRGDDA